MTQTIAAELDIASVYTPGQIARLATLQAIHGFTEGLVDNSDLIELAEYVIGFEDEVGVFAPGVAAPVFNTAYFTGPLSAADVTEAIEERDSLDEWERELLDHDDEGAITVSDLAGFLTLPDTAILEDTDGDTWTHVKGGGWTYFDDDYRIPSEIFMDYAEETCHFIVTNPEVLDTPAKTAVQPQVESVFALDEEGLDALPGGSVVMGEWCAWQREGGAWMWGHEAHSSERLLERYDPRVLVVLYVPGDARFPQPSVQL